MHDVFSRYIYFHIDVNNKSWDRDHTYSAAQTPCKRLQPTKDIEIVNQMQKIKLDTPRLLCTRYAMRECVLNTPKLSIFACPDWIELDAAQHFSSLALPFVGLADLEVIEVFVSHWELFHFKHDSMNFHIFVKSFLKSDDIIWTIVEP